MSAPPPIVLTFAGSDPTLDAVDAARVRMQAERVLADTRVAAIKLGLLGSAANVQVVAAILAEHAEIPVVLDPVLASGRGDVLATEETIAVLRELIVPQS